MSQITIQCRLVASEATRKLLWQLMAEKNTPLINLYVLQMVLEKLEEEIITNSTVVRRTSTGSSLQVPNELGEVYLDFLKNSNDIATVFFTMTDHPSLKRDIVDFISENNDASL